MKELTDFPVHEIRLLLCLKTLVSGPNVMKPRLSCQIICEQIEHCALHYKLLCPNCNYVD